MSGSSQMLRDRVRPLFYTRMRLGEFDPPAMNPYSTLDLSAVQSPEHRNLSLEAAVKSFVLLKNARGTLPLRARDLPGKRLAVSTAPGGGQGDTVTQGLLALYPGHAGVPSFGELQAAWHRAAGAHPHPSALHRWWVPSLTTPGCCLGTTRQFRSRGTSTLPGETARCCRPSPGPGHCPGLLLEPLDPSLGSGARGGVPKVPRPWGTAAPVPSPLPWCRRGLETLPANVSFAAGCREPQCHQYSRAEVVGAAGAADVVVVCLGTGRWARGGRWVGTAWGGGAPQNQGCSGKGTGPHRPPEAVGAPLPHLSAVLRAGCKGLSFGCPHAGTDVETEAKDRRDLSLPGHQLELLQDVVQAGRGSAGLGSRLGQSAGTWGLAGVPGVGASPERVEAQGGEPQPPCGVPHPWGSPEPP